MGLSDEENSEPSNQARNNTEPINAIQESKSELSRPKRPQLLPCIDNNNLSYILMLFSSFLWVCGYIYGSENNLSPIETAMPRSFVIIFVNFLACKYMKSEIDFKDKETFKKQMLRSTALILHGLVIAGVQFYLPLPITHTLGCTGPLFLFLVQYLLGGVKIVKSQLIGTCVAFFGIILVANGREVYRFLNPEYHFESKFLNYASEDPKSMIIASLVLICNMFVWAIAAYSTSTLKSDGFQTALHFGLCNLFFSSVAYTFLQEKTETDVMYLSFLWIGLPLGIGETVFTLSLALTNNVAVMSIIGLTTILFGYLMSVLRYGESLNVVCVLGTVLIVFGIVKTMWKN